jgi:hypothetical protein
MKTSGLKPLNLAKLRRDMQIVMDEIDRGGDAPAMWRRLQDTTEHVANAIQAVLLRLGGMSVAEVASKLGLKPRQIAAYGAWNTMLQPGWVAPGIIVAETSCPTCGAKKGERCNSHTTHRERREAHKRGES